MAFLRSTPSARATRFIRLVDVEIVLTERLLQA
jgi:hypothetical protein